MLGRLHSHKGGEIMVSETIKVHFLYSKLLEGRQG